MATCRTTIFTKITIWLILSTIYSYILINEWINFNRNSEEINKNNTKITYIISISARYSFTPSVDVWTKSHNIQCFNFFWFKWCFSYAFWFKYLQTITILASPFCARLEFNGFIINGNPMAGGSKAIFKIV